MKRVLVVTESKSVWGAERSLLKLARFAEAHGIFLHFLISADSPLGSELDKLDLPYSRHDFARHAALETTGSLSKAGLRQLFQELFSIIGGARRILPKLRGFDSVLVFSIWQAPEVILGSWVAHVPVDIDFHETFSNARAMRLLGLISRASRRIIVPSMVLAERSGLRASRRVVVIHRPVDLQAELPNVRITRNDGPLTVGVFGQIQPHKNVMAVARAVASVDGEIRFLVVGGAADVSSRTAYENELRTFVASMSNGAEVIDFISDPTKLMQSCEVVVNASEHEAFGRTIVEAVSVGCYPISVGDWGPRETIQALGVGSSIDSIEELPHVLSRLLIERQTAPLLDAVPATLASYESSIVARKYFALLGSGQK